MKTSSLYRLLAVAPLAAAMYFASPAAHAASGRISVKVGDQARSAFVVERYRAKRKLRPTIIVLGDAARVSTASRRGLRFQNFRAARWRFWFTPKPPEANGTWARKARMPAKSPICAP